MSVEKKCGMAILGFRLELRHWKMFAVAAVAISIGGAVTAAQPDPASAAVTATASVQTTAMATSDTTTDRATTEPQDRPPSPVISASSFSGGIITVVWEDPPASAQVTEYEYRHKTGPGRLWSNWVALPKTARKLTLIGLAENVQHHVVIRALNSIGKGYFSMASVGAASVPPAPDSWFLDDDDSVHEGAIEALATAGVVRGCGDRRYCPGEEITRGQFASLLTRAFPDLVVLGNIEDRFSDDDGNAHERAINALASTGITDGCGPGLFCPRDALTRAQAATLLARALPGLALADNDHFSDDDGNAHETAINVLAHNGIYSGCGPSRYCPDDPLTRAQAATLLARALDLEPTKPRPNPWRLEPVIDGTVPGFPVDLQAPTGDDRLFAATLSGAVLIIADGALLPEPFLDLTHKVLTHREEGLLGLAFHPDYAANHRFYVFYTDLNGHNQVYEYQADPENPNRADPSTARRIITFTQTCYTHNGGQLQFGPDGYLYIAVGDGGCPWPNEAPGVLNGQDPHNLLGTIVRIDVDNAAPYSIPPDNPFADGQQGLPEVWAYGLRNPWRFSFDSPNIYIADVGAELWEEVNIADASRGGINYGWAIMEGTNCYGTLIEHCNTAGLFIPQIDYPHIEGFSVIGGYVYRGTAIPEMVGHYFYTDVTGQWIRTFAYKGGRITQHYDWSQVVEMPFDLWSVWSFGKDGHGELYLLAERSIYKIIPKSG